MRIHIAHDRRGEPVIEIDGGECDKPEDIVRAYKETKEAIKNLSIDVAKRK